MILTEADQEEIIASYNRDLSNVIKAYSKSSKLHKSSVNNIILIQAENLKKEIIKEIIQRRNSFNDKNIESAKLIAFSLDRLISGNINNICSNNIISISNTSAMGSTYSESNHLRNMNSKY